MARIFVDAPDKEEMEDYLAHAILNAELNWDHVVHDWPAYNWLKAFQRGEVKL